MKTTRTIAKIAGVVLAGMLALTFVSCGKSKVQKALDSYEKFIVKIEKASASDNALAEYVSSAQEFADELDDLEGSAKWTSADTKRYMELTQRYAKASAKAIQSSANSFANSFDLSDFGF